MTFYSEQAQLAVDTLGQNKTQGIPTSFVHIMGHDAIERLASARPGGYRNDPHGVYVRMQRNIGVSMLDQYLAENPLTLGEGGYEGGAERGATTGGTVVLDGIRIDSPEAVVENMDRFACPRIEMQIAGFNEETVIQSMINSESAVQQLLGPDIVKTGHGAPFPQLNYGEYGYANFFMAYALYPEIMERIFRLQGDYAARYNEAMAKAYIRSGRPLYCRLDHDMADGSGLLVSMKSLERIWLPHFRRSVQPLADAGFKLVWHSDGNLMELYPYLIECGINGFQGFQYECGMDYPKICAMKTRDGREPLIIAGVSVTRTLPSGTPDDVRRELRYLVENGPETGLFLSISSSCLPGTPWVNIRALAEGLAYYRIHGRSQG